MNYDAREDHSVMTSYEDAGRQEDARWAAMRKDHENESGRAQEYWELMITLYDGAEIERRRQVARDHVDWDRKMGYLAGDCEICGTENSMKLTGSGWSTCLVCSFNLDPEVTYDREMDEGIARAREKND